QLPRDRMGEIIAPPIAGNEVDVGRRDPTLAAVEQAMCRGQDLPRTDQCTSAESARGPIDTPDGGPGPVQGFGGNPVVMTENARQAFRLRGRRHDREQWQTEEEKEARHTDAGRAICSRSAKTNGLFWRRAQTKRWLSAAAALGYWL